MDKVAELNQRWEQLLAGWAIPKEFIERAPESPYFFDPTVFTAAADEAVDRAGDSASDLVAREALPEGGSVLDVGAGAGAASLRLKPGQLTAVDPSATLLEALAARASKLGIEHAEIEGTWPEAAPRTPVVDVVVCHHVIYNVGDLASFVSTLATHARRRVVVELTAVHPMAWLTPYWRALHGLEQPLSPTAEDAIAVVAAHGFEPQQRRSFRNVQMIGELGDDRVARIARRLCLRPDRVPELRQLLAEIPPPGDREVVTLWWDRP
jgi:SAM-dependent methyltransferase